MTCPGCTQPLARTSWAWTPKLFEPLNCCDDNALIQTNCLFANQQTDKWTDILNIHYIWKLYTRTNKSTSFDSCHCTCQRIKTRLWKCVLSVTWRWGITGTVSGDVFILSSTGVKFLLNLIWFLMSILTLILRLCSWACPALISKALIREGCLIFLLLLPRKSQVSCCKSHSVATAIYRLTVKL